MPGIAQALVIRAWSFVIRSTFAFRPSAFFTGAARGLATPYGASDLLFLQRFQGFDHLVVVAVDADALPDLGDLAIGADQVGGALDAHALFAVHVLFAPGAVLLGDLVVGVGEQWEVERVLVAELHMAGDVVGADAQDLRAEVGQFLLAVAKVAGLFGAAWRVVLGIEVEHHGAAGQVAELDLLAGVADERKGGGFGARFEKVGHEDDSLCRWVGEICRIIEKMSRMRSGGPQDNALAGMDAVAPPRTCTVTAVSPLRTMMASEGRSRALRNQKENLWPFRL